MWPLLEKNRVFYEEHEQIKRSDKFAKLPQVVLANCTSEARDIFLRDNPTGGILYADEIRSYFSGLSRYSKTDDSAVSEYICIFDETPYSINRVTRDNFYVKSPYLSIFGGLQPYLIPKVLGSDILWYQGFYTRFLFGWIEHEQQMERIVKEQSADYDEQWNQFILNIYEREFPSDPRRPLSSAPQQCLTSSG